MLGNLAHKGAGGGIVNTGDIVHATNDEVCGIGRPCQVIDLGTGRPAHVLRPPCLLVVKVFVADDGMVTLGWYP